MRGERSNMIICSYFLTEWLSGAAPSYVLSFNTKPQRPIPLQLARLGYLPSAASTIVDSLHGSRGHVSCGPLF